MTYRQNIFLLFFVIIIFLAPSFAENLKSVEKIDFANGLMRKGFYQMAEEEYRTFIDIFLDSQYLEEAYFGLGESLFCQNSFGQALLEYKSFVKKYPESKKKSVAHLRIAQSYLKLNELDKALVALNSFPPVSEKDIKQGVFYYKGKALQAKGSTLKALNSFIKAGRISEAERFRALALLEAGKIFSFQKNYQKALEFYQKAYNAAESQPVKHLILFEKGEMEFSTKNYQKSALIFETILNQCEKETTVEDGIYRESFLYFLMSYYKLFEYKKVIDAYNRYKELAAFDNNFFDLYYLAAASYQRLSRFEEALKLLDELLSQAELESENKQKGVLKKAEILLETKENRKVIELIEQEFGEKAENIPAALFLKAEAYHELGKFGIAYDCYQTIAKAFPDSKFSDEANYSMAYCWLLMGKDSQAHQLFFNYFREGEDSKKKQDALYNVIVIERKIRALKNAAKHSQLYLSEFPESKLKEDILFQLGFLYSGLDENEKAVETFKQFIDQFTGSPRISQAYFLLGYSLQLLENYKEALEYYSRVKADNGNDSYYYSSLKNSALIYLNRENEKEAVWAFEKIIEGFKDNGLAPDTYFWLSQHYLDQEDFKKTLEIIEKVVREKNISGGTPEVSYLKAEAYQGLGDYKKAIQNYDLVLDNPGENNSFGAAAHIGKALCLESLGELEAAESELESAISQSPDDHTITLRARFELAELKHKQGEKSKAVKFYMLVSVLYDDEKYVPLSLKKAGEILESRGQKEEAARVYNEILNKYPQSPVSKTVKARLDEINAK